MVVNAKDYYFSSARNYAGLNNNLEVEVVFIGYNNTNLANLHSEFILDMINNIKRMMKMG
ncbi:hypothetical protein [Empedobacter brevis]|uniref:hypothetical protein n=1 Tax=Empedobacter brevis TaxID=247 RepID=UPI0039B03C77